jgi:hypothetical protein
MICSFCQKICLNENSHRNHERTCPLNKDRKYISHTKGKTAWNKGLKGHPKCIRINKKGTPHTEDMKKHLSEVAKSKGYGGYKENSGRSKKYYILDSFNNKVCLQSSYEKRCADILNSLKISWVRPSYLCYDNRKYFPDFYLPEHDIYLDPKNKYKSLIDKDKIEKVKTQNNVKVFILLDEQLTIDYIKELISLYSSVG